MLIHADAWHSIVNRSSSAAVAIALGGIVVSREPPRDRERLAGRDTQVDSKTCDERKEKAYERLRASQWNIVVATRYRCVELLCQQAE